MRCCGPAGRSSLVGEVVGLRAEVPPGEPNADVIKALEAMLDRARRGEIISLAYATVTPGRAVGTGWDGAANSKYEMLAGVAMLNQRIASAALAAADPA